MDELHVIFRLYYGVHIIINLLDFTTTTTGIATKFYNKQLGFVARLSLGGFFKSVLV